MLTTRDGIPQGTLDLLILKTLDRHDELHGFQIANAIQALSRGVLQAEEGSLYPALRRMLIKGRLAAEWGKTSENHRARYYRITKDGGKQLSRELGRYGRVGEAIARILAPA